MRIIKNKQSEDEKKDIFKHLKQAFQTWEIKFHFIEGQMMKWFESEKDEKNRIIIAEKLSDDFENHEDISTLYHTLTDLHEMVDEAVFKLQYENKSTLAERIAKGYSTIIELTETLNNRAEEFFEENPYNNPDRKLFKDDCLSGEDYFNYNPEISCAEQIGPFAYSSGISSELESMMDLLGKLVEVELRSQPSSNTVDTKQEIKDTKVQLFESIRRACQDVDKLEENNIDFSKSSFEETALAEAAVIDYLTKKFGEQGDAVGNWPRDWHECPEAIELYKTKIREYRELKAKVSIDEVRKTAETKTETEQKNKATKKGRPKKHSDQDLSRMISLHEKEYAVSKDSKAAWSEVAKVFGILTGDAVRVACMKYQKKLKKST